MLIPAIPIDYPRTRPFSLDSIFVFPSCNNKKILLFNILFYFIEFKE